MLNALNRISALVVVAAVLAGCAGGGTRNGDLRATIEANNRKWEAALSRGDARGIAALYTADGQLLPANGKVVSGRQAIEEYWQAGIKAGFNAVTLTTLELQGCGETAWEVGRFTVPGEGGKVLDTGEYVVIWKREGGQWKLHRDIWTTNSPAPGQ